MPYVGTKFAAAATPSGQFIGRYAGISGMHNLNDPVDTNFEMTEIAFQYGVTRQDLGKPIVASHTVDIGTSVNLHDVDLTSLARWISNQAAWTTTSFYFGYDFTTPPLLDGVRIASSTNLNLCPTQLSVMQSTDRNNWCLVASSLVPAIPGGPEAYGALLPFVTLTPPGAKRYWRLTNWNMLEAGSPQEMWISEVALYVGTTNVNSLATITDTHASYAAGSLANLLDGNAATTAQISNANIGTFRWDFGGSPQAVDGLRFGSGASIAKYPKRVDLQWSNDGSSWNFAGRLMVLQYPGDNNAGVVVRLY
jgi:hypothetical protein